METKNEMSKPSEQNFINFTPKTKGVNDMKNVTKRKDGRYFYRKQINKQRLNIYASTVTELKEKLKNFNLIKTYTRKTKNDKTLLEWCEEWKSTYKDNFVKKCTQWNLNAFIKHIKISSLSDKYLKQIETKDIQLYLNSLQKSRTKEIICLYLNASLNKAQELKLIDNNPFKNIVKDKKIKKIRKAFTYIEQKTIFENITKTNFFAPIFVYLFCGIRKNELSKTIYNNIQEDNTLKVQCEKKRDEETIYRYIDITPKLKEIILSNKDQFKTLPDWTYRRFKKFLKTYNINGNLHMLRHTFTTNHLYLGTPDKFIQNWLGHEDISTTKNNYMNIDKTLSKEKLLNLYDGYYYIINT